MKIKTGIRAAGVQGPGAEFSQRALRAARGKVRAPSPKRSAGRGLARSGPPVTIERPEGKQL